MTGRFSILEKVRGEGRSVLTEFESKELIRQVGIPIVETRLAKTKEEAVRLSQEIGFPIALKIISPNVIHKSDSGGVKLGLKNEGEVSTAYEEIMEGVRRLHPDASIHGLSVQKMAAPGTEVIIGTGKDPQFGSFIMFGLGGIFVEVLKDVSFRIVPIDKRDAYEMIREIKGYPLLQGYRGKEPVGLDVLVEIILKLSDFIQVTPLIRELELNPIFAYKDSAVIVDARIIVEN